MGARGSGRRALVHPPWRAALHRRLRRDHRHLDPQRCRCWWSPTSPAASTRSTWPTGRWPREPRRRGVRARACWSPRGRSTNLAPAPTALRAADVIGHAGARRVRHRPGGAVGDLRAVGRRMRRRCSKALPCWPSIYLVTSYAVVRAARLGAAAQRRRRCVALGGLVVRALPLLLLFTTFLFINAEVWQVAGTLAGPAYIATLAIFFLLGAVFVLSRMPALMRGLSTFHDWTEVARAGRRHAGRGAARARRRATPPHVPLSTPPEAERRSGHRVQPGAADHVRRARC